MYLLRYYSANQGNHTSFKVITGIFHCGSSRSFRMKGAHLNKAHNMLWMQPVGYISSTHKSRWGIFLNFPEMPTANLTLTVGTELKPGHWSDHQLQDTGWLPASWAHLSLFSLEKWTALRNRVSETNEKISFAVTLQFPLWLQFFSLQLASPGHLQRPLLLEACAEVFISQLLRYCCYRQTNIRHSVSPQLHTFK